MKAKYVSEEDQFTALKVINLVCEIMDQSKRAVLSRRRDHELVECRAMISHILVHEESMVYTVVGKMTIKDHSSIINSFKTHASLYSTNHRGYRDSYDLVYEKYMMDKIAPAVDSSARCQIERVNNTIDELRKIRTFLIKDYLEDGEVDVKTLATDIEEIKIPTDA